jgi:hypothetical protein
MGELLQTKSKRREHLAAGGFEPPTKGTELQSINFS